MGKCRNNSCYLVLVCRHRNAANNCSIHRWYLKGEGVIQYPEEEMKEIEKMVDFDRFSASGEKISHERTKNV